ncbi:MAG: acyl carrier protein [marine bacterium B5-7]|nr:MAG: acyl carrier protein [marine bacterium B5-7]
MILREIQELIVTSLNLPDMTADDVDPDQRLFDGDGLGLDSIDALELGVALQERFKLNLKGRTEEVREHFETARSLANFVESELASPA